ncbi:ester cyclase [Vibrio sp. RM-69-4]|uniref:ester cyclase n=1 Tax=Vibrio sp. RM-69-4 TaxID=2950157 RepID=UPI0038674FF9
MNYKNQKVMLARNFMSHAWLGNNHHNLSGFLTPQVLVRSPVRESVGCNNLSDVFSIWFRGFPNLSYKERKLQVTRDRVIIEWEINGNHLGQFLGVAATGKRINCSGTTSLVIFDQLIHSYSTDVNISLFLKQLSTHQYTTDNTAGDNMRLAVNRRLSLSLTNRQIDCLSLLCLRCDRETISSALNIKYCTFRTHVDRILPLIGLTSRKDVFDWALSFHILDLLINIGLEKIHSQLHNQKTYIKLSGSSF